MHKAMTQNLLKASPKPETLQSAIKQEREPSAAAKIDKSWQRPCPTLKTNKPIVIATNK